MRKDHGRIVVKLDFARPASIDGTVPAEPMTSLEGARQILRGVHSGMVTLRRDSGVVWDSPAVNFGLIPLTDQLAAGLAILEEVDRD